MGRLPRGVAMGVSGEAQTQPEQPLSQVPVEGSGAWQWGPLETGPGTSQQIWPPAQHWLPQQNWEPAQVGPLQGGVPQVPLSQKG